MKKLLYPFAVVFESLLIFLCWFLSLFGMSKAVDVIIDFCWSKLPGKDWYFPKKR